MIEPITSPGSAVEVKGSMVRAFVQSLTDHGLRDKVMVRVTPEAAALIREPPVATMWVDGRLHNEILQAILELVGPERLRTINRDAVARGVNPLLRATAMRLLRIFGTSPSTLLSKLDRVGGSTARGVVYGFTPTGAASGWFEVSYPGLATVPLGAFVATGGGLVLIFEMCGVQGSFGEPEWVANGRRNRARYSVSWWD